MEAGAASYVAKNKERLRLESSDIDPALRVDDKFATETAAEYVKLPAHATDAETQRAYKALVEETEEQYKHLTEDMGVKVEFVDHDPYADAAAMMQDVMNNKHLSVYKTAEDQVHPYLTTAQNDQFRAVHDFFGHAGNGNRFDRHGEEIAFRKHAQMFSPDARRAMATETRGQNAMLNYGPNKGSFPEQKAALLPEKYSRTTPTLRSRQRRSGSVRWRMPGSRGQRRSARWSAPSASKA